MFDQQFMVVASEKQCRVMTLPSQNCIFKQQITDTDYVIKAEIINLKGESVGGLPIITHLSIQNCGCLPNMSICLIPGLHVPIHGVVHLFAGWWMRMNMHVIHSFVLPWLRTVDVPLNSN